MQCPLCKDTNKPTLYFEDSERPYYACKCCGLIYVTPAYQLTPEEEKKRYDTHENDPNDPRYIKFLSRLSTPLLTFIKPESHGLDFGSGPGPALHLMLEEKGHQVALYDCFYAPNKEVFQKDYDFITMSEVIEHLRDPLKELKRLWDCLRPNGFLAIMTQRVPEDFQNWAYIRDETHVCFFSLETFNWIENTLAGKTIYTDRNVIIFQKV